MWAYCDVVSERHVIDVDSFNRLASNELNFRVLRLDNHRIRVFVRAAGPCSELELLHHAHLVIKALVLALNVASLGHFFWHNGPWAHPVFALAEDLLGSNAREFALVTSSPRVDVENRAFSDADEYRATLLFGVFARSSAHVLEDEYCRGLLLLQMQFGEIDFRRDAFMCFYRVLEHFVTRRVLGIPKLQNELKDIQSCIRALGFSEDVIAEMKELYIIRSSQTAHAQNIQRQITSEEVLKLKVYVDACLFKVLFEEANTIMERKYGPRPGSPNHSGDTLAG